MYVCGGRVVLDRVLIVFVLGAVSGDPMVVRSLELVCVSASKFLTVCDPDFPRAWLLKRIDKQFHWAYNRLSALGNPFYASPMFWISGLRV